MTSPRWLTAEQQSVWRNWLTATARVSDAVNADLRRHGLDLNEYEVLVVLSEATEHSARMSEIAEGTNQSRSRLTHTVARLEREGYIERRPAPSDGRGVLAHLTDSGYRKLEETAPSHVESVRSAFVDLMDEDSFRAMGAALGQIVE